VNVNERIICNSQRWCGICAYDGTDFNGWQSQTGGNTIQDFLELRLSQIFHRRVQVFGAGRTDAGVHARAQVFHFDAAEWKCGSEKLLRALQCGFPKTIRVLHIYGVDGAFHARFSAKCKRYVYEFQPGLHDPFHCRFRWNTGHYNLDVDTMSTAATYFLGTHDFRAFANLRNDGTDNNFTKTLINSRIKRREDYFAYIIEGDGFLYRMVRRIVGALVDVGRRKITCDDIKERLFEPLKKYVYIPSAAPPTGLFLDKVFYLDR
jgi:tRNA pseudouridine38-40 synthase